jgi:hypothetical protein
MRSGEEHLRIALIRVRFKERSSLRKNEKEAVQAKPTLIPTYDWSVAKEDTYVQNAAQSHCESNYDYDEPRERL